MIWIWIILQGQESLEVLEEAIQAAALEADFTFPDDKSSTQGDQSMVIDDIIESLEIDALEAEQEALLVQRAQEEAQVHQLPSWSIIVLLYVIAAICHRLHTNFHCCSRNP